MLHLQEDYYYEMIFNSTNGLLIPGGAVSLTDSGKMRATSPHTTELKKSKT